MDLLAVFNLGVYTNYLRLLHVFATNPYVRKEDYVLDNLKRVHGLLEDEKLGMDVIDDVSKWINKLDKGYPEEEMRVSEQDATKLGKAVEKWRDKIRRELRDAPILRIELQSGLNPDELRKVADKLPSEFISAEIWEKLTEIEKSDFSDAARCLLLGTATPSVMVALRGAEASIRNYYHHKTQSDPGKKTWRQLTQELKGKAKTLGIEDTFVGYLDYIGDAKRNFAQHPNKIYSLRGAVIIFMQVVGLIEDIYAQL